MLVNADLLVAGVITLIQSLGAGKFAGARIPVVGGAAFAQVATIISIGNTYGLPAIWGCMLAGGVIGLALAWPFSKLLKYFPPLVTGAVLLVLGISLIGVPGGLILGDEGTDSYARPLYIGIAAIVVVIAFGLSALARGMVAKAPLLIAVVTPFHFGSPEFPVVGVISMTVVMMFLFSETIASVGALSEITGMKLSRGDVARALSGDALSGVLGGIFNGFYDTVFTQNVGAIKTTRVHSPVRHRDLRCDAAAHGSHAGDRSGHRRAAGPRGRRGVDDADHLDRRGGRLHPAQGGSRRHDQLPDPLSGGGRGSALRVRVGHLDQFPGLGADAPVRRRGPRRPLRLLPQPAVQPHVPGGEGAGLAQ